MPQHRSLKQIHACTYSRGKSDLISTLRQTIGPYEQLIISTTTTTTTTTNDVFINAALYFLNENEKKLNNDRSNLIIICDARERSKKVETSIRDDKNGF